MGCANLKAWGVLLLQGGGVLVRVQGVLVRAWGVLVTSLCRMM